MYLIYHGCVGGEGERTGDDNGGIHPCDLQLFSLGPLLAITELYHFIKSAVKFATTPGCSALSSCRSYGSLTMSKSRYTSRRK